MESAGGIDLLATLRLVDVPSFVSSRDGRITWMNDAALAVVGDLIDGPPAQAVVPEQQSFVRGQLKRKLNGVPVTNYEADVLDRNGELVRATISSVPIAGGDDEHAFLAVATYRRHPDAERTRLTPRQMEVLRLLADGKSTSEISGGLHLTKETVRNYVRLILRALGAHSRLEAVAVARRRGLL